MMKLMNDDRRDDNYKPKPEAPRPHACLLARARETLESVSLCTRFSGFLTTSSFSFNRLTLSTRGFRPRISADIPRPSSQIRGNPRQFPDSSALFREKSMLGVASWIRRAPRALDLRGGADLARAADPVASSCRYARIPKRIHILARI